MSGKSRYSIDILEVSLDLVERLGQDVSTPLKASHLARELGVTHNRVFRILKTLETRGYVEVVSATDGYQLGPGFIALGERARERIELDKVPRPILVEPAEETGDAAYWIVRPGKTRGRQLYWQPRPVVSSQVDGLTRLGLPERTREETERFESEARSIVEAAQEQGIVLRLLGALAFAVRCPRYGNLQGALGRTYSDINLAGYRAQATQVSAFFASLGYREDPEINLMYAGKQMLFYHPIIPNLHVDVFLDKLDFCHPISWVDRLEDCTLTLPPAELLMEKLQIVEINEKDIIDSIVLLLEHSLGGDDKEGINVARVAQLCGNDWGMWRTFTMNLDKIDQMAQLYEDLGVELKERIRTQIATIKSCIEREPKSLAWRLRARVGDRVKWYQEVDEIV